MKILKKNDLIKARTLCDISRYFDDVNSINPGGEVQGSYSSI